MILSSDKYLISLEFDKIRCALSNCAGTKSAKEEALKIVPYESKEEIEKQINFVTEAKKILDIEGVNSAPFEFSVDPDVVITQGILSVNNVIDLTKTLVTSRKLKNFLSRNKEAISINSVFVEKLYSNKELEDKIHNVFDENYNIKDNATDELFSLKSSLVSWNNNLKNAITGLLNNSDFTSHLQDTIYTERMGRTVFQVKAVDKTKVKGIVHDVSATNKTFFIEPEELVSINNKIRAAECAIEAEIERIMAELSLDFVKIKPELKEAHENITKLDLIFAKAKYSIKTKSTPPVVLDKKIIKLQNMFHPLLFDKENLVKNDFELGVNFKSMLITGSNTGGKTVTLKTAGLIVLMMNSGMHVTADYAEVYPFSHVYTDIEERQDITQSLSTYSAHIKNIASIVDNVSEDDLVLLDELGAGTDPVEGAAVARSLLEFFNKKNVLTISTTHLGELKILEYENPDFKNASVEFDTIDMKPLYKLVIGLAGSSYAIDIAKNYNLSDEIIIRAKEILTKNKNPEHGIFNKIQETHQELLSHTKKIEISKISVEKKEEELEEKIKEIKEKKKQTLANFKKKYQSGLDNAREEIKETLDSIRREKSEKAVRRAYSRLAKLEQKARSEFTKDEDELQNKYPPLNWEEIQLGQSALVVGINQPAVIKSYPDNKGMVEIQMGLIKSKIHKSKLAKTDKKVSKGIKKLSVSFDDFHAGGGLSFSPRLDLRGMRADEALDSVEHHLDLAELRNINEFTIIHGHGTGALKKAVRDYLKESPYVLKFRPGEDTEGGDGVTIVSVK